MPNDTQLIQDAANMGVLARQAIGNEFPTMEVDPKVCANVALLVERLMQTHDEAPQEAAPEGDTVPAMLEHAKEEGRREAIGEHAQEKADMLQRINDLEASCENLNMRLVAAVAERDAARAPLTTDADGAPVKEDLPGQQPLFPDGNAATSDGNEFKGPGQS